MACALRRDGRGDGRGKLRGDFPCDAGRRGRHVENTAHRLHRGRDRVRSGGLERHLFRQRAARDFRFALWIRLPHAALSADDADRGGDAGSYGKNIEQTNYARFALPEYDDLYRASRRLPDGSERNKIYRRMSELVAAYNPWWLGVYTIENTLLQPWVQGYKKHAYWEHPWKYLDVDAARQRTSK
jgi:hypothetical protein